MVIPRLLYRGDSDSHNVRQLKSTFQSGLLLTNLINGGNGREIMSYSLEKLATKHIITRWEKTHFLSFSSDEQIALYYGSNNKAFEDVNNDKGIWDFALLTFDTTLLIQDTVKEIEPGIYSAQFYPTCKEFLPTYKVIIMDVTTHLKSRVSKVDIDLNEAIAKAIHDKEWLLLPASPFNDNGEFTAKLDTNCIIEKRIYRYT